MRIDDFEGQYSHGFSNAFDSVLCRVGLKEPSAVGFRIVSDTLLFYRMVQGHFRRLRFWSRVRLVRSIADTVESPAHSSAGVRFGSSRVSLVYRLDCCGGGVSEASPSGRARSRSRCAARGARRRPTLRRIQAVRRRRRGTNRRVGRKAAIHPAARG
jgi:hypothetical protein